MDVQRFSGTTQSGVRTTPGAPIKRQPIAAGEATIDPMEILSQRHKQESQALRGQFEQEWASIRRMERVVGFEKTQKIAAEAHTKATQAQLKLQQQFEMMRNQFAEMDTLYSEQPEAARRAKFRGIYGAEEAERMVPSKTDPGARLGNLLSQATQLKRYMNVTYQVRPKRKKINLPVAAARMTGVGGFIAGGVYDRWGPKSKQERPVDIWDYSGGKDGMGGWRPLAPHERPAYDNLRAQEKAIQEGIVAVNKRTHGAGPNLNEVAKESQRLGGGAGSGTFDQKIQFSDPRLDPRPKPTRSAAPAATAGGRVRVIHSDGRSGTIPASRLDAALRGGFRRAQ